MFGNWADIEPERGKGYRFEPFDDLVQKASDRGIEIIALVYPDPRRGPPAPRRCRSSEPVRHTIRYELPKRECEESDFRRFVRAMVTRYCGQRPESLRAESARSAIGFSTMSWMPVPVSLDEYAVWLKIFHEEVKAIDPEPLKVIANAGFPSVAAGLVRHTGTLAR